MMSLPEERRAHVAVEAAEWLLRFDERPLTRPEKAEFEGWLRESPLHVAEFLAVSSVRRRLTGFREWPSVSDSTLAPELTSAAARRPAVDNRAPAPPSRWSSRRLAAIAAAVLMLLSLPAVLRFAAPSHEVTTLTAEKREVRLEDGSIVRLLPETRLRIAYGGDVRRIELLHGEALFRVAKDPHRAFVVEAGRVSVRAVGTVFSVQRASSTEVVTVQEGQVVVATAGSPSGTSEAYAGRTVALRANQRLAVTSRGQLESVTAVAGIPGNEEDAFDWYSRHIVFTDVAVAKVVEDFNRRNHVKIRVLDSQVAARRVTGSFSDDDPQSFAAFLGTIPGVTIHVGDRDIVVGPVGESDEPRSP